MGQEEYVRLFPQSVLPDKIMDTVPLSAMLNGSLTANLPDSDAKAAAGNVFTWSSLAGELHLFAGGSFNNNLTYLAQLTVNKNGADIETGYLLWNDIFGPRHLVNLWIGRLMAPQLTNFGLHSSYLSDTVLPPISISALYNPTGSFALGQPHSDGIELNGIINHRIGYAIGWLASQQATALKAIDAEDVYAHIGLKSGGIALDGEGKYGPSPPDPMKPWAERSITIDAFAYHGMNSLDNGTGTVAGGATTAVAQRDAIGVIGGSIHAQLDSLTVTTGLQFEHHDAPYQGTAAVTNPDGSITNGMASAAKGNAWVQYNEIDYVIFPWLVPGVRTEFTTMTIDQSNPASLFRLIPGIATLVRPNIRVVVTADFDWAYGNPVTKAWGPAGGFIVAPGPGQSTKVEAETITATAALAF